MREENMSRQNKQVIKSDFKQFFEKEIRPLIEQYIPLSNRELWYYQFYINVVDDIDPKEYVESLFFLLNEPKLSFDFKSLILQIAYIITFKYLKSKA